MDIKVELLKREIIRKVNEELDDFMTVERIVMVFEKYGLDSLPCHDFG